MKCLQRALVYVLTASLLGLASPLAAEAGVISTLDAIQSTQAQADLAKINGLLAHDHVREQMHALGVDEAHVQARLARLTDAELNELASRIDTAPAGGLLEVVGVVFVVLLILEAVGVIDIFKKFP